MLDVQQLSVSYGKHLAIVDVSLSVGRGEIVVMLGANGAGKSSCLKALGGAVPHLPGARISLGDTDLTALPQHPDDEEEVDGREDDVHRDHGPDPDGRVEDDEDDARHGVEEPQAQDAGLEQGEDEERRPEPAEGVDPPHGVSAARSGSRPGADVRVRCRRGPGARPGPVDLPG